MELHERTRIATESVDEERPDQQVPGHKTKQDSEISLTRHLLAAGEGKHQDQQHSSFLVEATEAKGKCEG